MEWKRIQELKVDHYESSFYDGYGWVTAFDEGTVKINGAEVDLNVIIFEQYASSTFAHRLRNKGGITKEMLWLWMRALVCVQFIFFDR